MPLSVYRAGPDGYGHGRGSVGRVGRRAGGPAVDHLVDGSGQVPDARERRCPRGRTWLMPLGRRGLLMTWTRSDAFPSDARVEHRALPSPGRRARPDSHAMQYGPDRLGSRARVFGATCMISLRSPVTMGPPPRSNSSMHGKITPATHTPARHPSFYVLLWPIRPSRNVNLGRARGPCM